jgi:hypothetical protein
MEGNGQMGLYLAEVERVEAVETRLAGGVLHFRLSEWLQENAAKLEKIITEVYHWRMAAVETISLREIQKRSWPRVPFLTAASCSLVSFSVPKVSTVPGNVNKSWAMAPAVASMARRPFFSSASRNHLKKKIQTTLKLNRPVKMCVPGIEPARDGKRIKASVTSPRAVEHRSLGTAKGGNSNVVLIAHRM